MFYGQNISKFLSIFTMYFNENKHYLVKVTSGRILLLGHNIDVGYVVLEPFKCQISKLLDKKINKCMRKNAHLNLHLHHVKMCLQISSDYLEIFLLNKIQ